MQSRKIGLGMPQLLSAINSELGLIQVFRGTGDAILDRLVHNGSQDSLERRLYEEEVTSLDQKTKAVTLSDPLAEVRQVIRQQHRPRHRRGSPRQDHQQLPSSLNLHLVAKGVELRVSTNSFISTIVWLSRDIF